MNRPRRGPGSEPGPRLSGTDEPTRRALSRHYLPSRYPDALPGGAPGDHYRQDDSRQAVTDAVAVLGFVDRSWRALVTADPEAAGGSEQQGHGW